MLDSLLAVFIIICMCGLCFSIYRASLLYEYGHEDYREQTNSEIEAILNGMTACEGCASDESD